MAETSVTTAETSVKRHPIAAVLWGIVGGIGVSLFLIGQAQIAFGKWTAPIIIIVIVVALNLLWAYFGPAKKPKGAPPIRMEPEPMPMDQAGFGAEAAAEAEDATSEPDEDGS